MNRETGPVFFYLLVDNGLLQEASRNYGEPDAKSRPVWLQPIYVQSALEVSPFLIDIEAAFESGDIEQVMLFWNACKPALHVSIIESELRLEDIAQHFRRFIFVTDSTNRHFTLRFADCTVLACLSSVLTPAQWTAMTDPVRRWGVHGRSGSVTQLPTNRCEKCATTPLRLDQEQLEELNELSEPDHFIAKVTMMHHGAEFPGNAEDQHAWAKSARQQWKAAENSNPMSLLFLTEAMLLSGGAVLQREEVKNFLAMNDANDFREKLKDLVNNR